ncbi:MAG: carbohydrate-binding protein [Steroidobacteraceae bacterium]
MDTQQWIAAPLRRLVMAVALAASLAACQSDSGGSSGEAASPGTPANRAPTISGRPATTATVGGNYTFSPEAGDPEGAALAFSIANRPSWLEFDAATGRLSGTPASDDVGAHADIVIGVSDGTLRAELPVFGIAVQPDSAGPFAGTPIPVPSDFEAEDFDRGGQGVAYRDLSAGNAGGLYRPVEDVDLAASSDALGGGFVVNGFETGEWLAYSINVGASGRYDLALRVASAMTGGAFHLELDGADVSGRVTVPNTGSWDAYQWVVRADVPLSAGTHVLKVVADQQYFNLNSLRVTPTGSSLPSGSAQALFRSGFEGTTALLPPLNCWGTGCWQDLIGLDSLSNFSWPPQLWGGGGKFLLLSEPVITTALNIGNRMFNRIDTVTGPRGNQTRSLLQQISYNVNGTGPMGSSSEQNEFQFLPRQETSDLYLSYWLKLQPDLVQKMATDYWGNNGTWRAIFAFKTGGQTAWGDPANNGDYRVEAYVRSSGGQMFWSILGDNNAGGGAPLVNNWNLENRSIPVPIGTWFKLEFFWHRSNGADGRIWMAANGQPIADRRGPNMGAWNLPINRIIAPMLYTGGAMPVYQWVDDLEIWDGFPAANGDNPPYAPH